ncbi:ribokinase [Lacticaseibacillus thailandensis]|uniref:Ribokinase n=1 Tax=Lacticaseibacillus thailandensis DSM 22698 = JCM 13996 TaxID=1423810 RepID=A0A0R2C9F4_9LACO|nr:ribokinase [Lacticaseibacillus thailandensis]KRM88429.1 ribokinase [Lacticaseibacillus thailandensis DSM 22698 = JCM 13996]
MTLAIIGSINLDQIFAVQQIPHPGETLIADSLTEAPGGKGANQAVAAALNGVDVDFIGRVGDDGSGISLRQSLVAKGVQATHLITDTHEPTGRAVIMVEPSGENRIVVASGANAAVTMADVQPVLEQLGPDDFLMATFESPIQTITDAFTAAKQHGVKTVLNPAPARHGVPIGLLAATDIIIPNEGEATALTGIDMVDAAATAEAAATLRQQGAGEVIITLAERGSYYSGPSGDFSVPAYTVQAVDTTGAGDTFIGAFLSQYGQGDVAAAIDYATAASAIAVAHAGGQPSIPSADAVTAFLKEAH